MLPGLSRHSTPREVSSDLVHERITRRTLLKCSEVRATPEELLPNLHRPPLRA